MLTTKKPSHLAALLLAVTLAAGLSACAAADPSGGNSSAPEPQGSGTQSFDSFDEYQLAFAQCMRDRGIDMGDPDGGGQSITQADDAFLEAAEACQSEIGEPPANTGDAGTGGPSAEELREEHLKIAECLRELGVDVPDPAPGEDLAIPSDVPAEAFETCAPSGVMGSTGGK